MMEPHTHTRTQMNTKGEREDSGGCTLVFLSLATTIPTTRVMVMVKLWMPRGMPRSHTSYSTMHGSSSSHWLHPLRHGKHMKSWGHVHTTQHKTGSRSVLLAIYILNIYGTPWCTSKCSIIHMYILVCICTSMHIFSIQPVCSWVRCCPPSQGTLFPPVCPRRLCCCVPWVLDCRSRLCSDTRSFPSETRFQANGRTSDKIRSEHD